MHQASPDLLRRLKNRSNRPGNFTQILGLVVTELTYRRAVGTVSPTPENCNPRGIIHGGALFSVMDQLAGLAACTNGCGTVTIGGSIDYLRPVSPGQTLTAVATVLKPGKRFSQCEATIQDEEGRLIAKASFTYCTMEPLEDTLALTGD